MAKENYFIDYITKKFTKEKISLVTISDFYLCSYPNYPSCVKESYHLATVKEGEKLSRKHYPSSHTVLIKE